MFSCINSSKFNMTALVLNQGVTSPDTEGQWASKQDPDTGEIIRVWSGDSDSGTVGNQPNVISCLARAVIDGGIRVAGTTERWNTAGMYENVDFVKMSCPAESKITKRDRVTNIADTNGKIIWREEEYDSAPTVFEVLGVAPVLGPFGELMEWSILLQRAEVQSNV